MTGAGAGPADHSGNIANAPAASLSRRWCALVYECLLLCAVVLVAGFVALPLVGPPHAGPVYNAQQLYLLSGASSAFLFFFEVVVAGVYCVGFWSNGRRTLAMKTWRLTLATRTGTPVDVRQATVRYFAGWIGPLAGLVCVASFGRLALAAGLLNYYWAWLDSDGQFLHDRIAGTRIIRA